MSSSVRRPKGHMVVDGREVGDTLQCPHCGAHFQIIRGGKKQVQWPYCMNCGSLTCGKGCCHECVPFERKLDLYEKGIITELK